MHRPGNRYADGVGPGLYNTTDADRADFTPLSSELSFVNVLFNLIRRFDVAKIMKIII